MMVPERKSEELQRSCDEDLPTTLARVEREMIVEALRASRGNKAKAARSLGISERLMGLRVKKHAIDPGIYRAGPERHLERA